MNLCTSEANGYILQEVREEYSDSILERTFMRCIYTYDLMKNDAFIAELCFRIIDGVVTDGEIAFPSVFKSVNGEEYIVKNILDEGLVNFEMLNIVNGSQTIIRVTIPPTVAVHDNAIVGFVSDPSIISTIDLLWDKVTSSMTLLGAACSE